MIKHWLLFLGISLSFTLANIEKDLQNLNITGIGELPSNITSKIPSAEDVEKAFAEKCRKYGGKEAFEQAMAAKQKAIDCVKDLINFDQLQQEMEEAKPTGDLDSVFKKYCKKSPQFKGCISNFTTAVQPCLEEKEKNSVSTLLNVTEQLAEFICYKEGDRIALFIAEGGPECLNDSKDAIRHCVETVFKQNFQNPEDIGLNEIGAHWLFKTEQCEDFFKLQTCVVHQLEKCEQPTPANIVESLFNFIKKVTPCSSYKFVEPSSESGQRSNSIGLNISFFSFFWIYFLSLALLRFLSNH